jgi:hypothetical protein
MLGEHTANDIFIDFDPEGQAELLSDPRAYPAWITSLHLDNGIDEFRGGAFRPWLAVPF